MATEFDEKAATWDDDPIRVKRAESIAKTMAEKIDLKKINSALEYGSGTGLLSFSLKDKLKHVVLMDESAEMTKVAQAKCINQSLDHFKPMQYDLMKDELPQARFDLIYILLTLHHILDYESILQKFAKLLNKNGYLAIIDLEKEDGSFHEGDFYGHKGFDKCILIDKLEEAGFIDKTYDVCYELERETESGVKKYPLFLLVSEKRD